MLNYTAIVLDVTGLFTGLTGNTIDALLEASIREEKHTIRNSEPSYDY